ncbi:MAG: hypothetical protein AMXMBFR84_25920 [Candidatus Hydrogenedentota bacterium]
MTAGDVIALVRQKLHDDTAGAYRWTDASLLGYLYDAQRAVKHYAPHYYLTADDTIAEIVEPTTLNDTLTLDRRGKEPLALWVCSKALSEEGQDAANIQLSGVFASACLAELLGLSPRVGK